MRIIMKNILTALLLSALIAPELFAQITIAPTNLFLDSNSRFGTYLVLNNSNENQEVSVEFFFGYSSTDSLGHRKSVENDSRNLSQYSIAEAVRAFPQNFILAPGKRQTVRLRIAPRNNLPDGTYWARIKTISTPESQAIELSQSESVSAQLGIIVEQVTGLFYKNGLVFTGIDIENVDYRIEEGKLVILTDFKLKGNSPFLGSIYVKVLDPEGKTVEQQYASTSYYLDGTHRQEFSLSDIPSGNHTVEVKFEAKRSDISPDDIIKMDPVTATTTVTIP